MNGSRFVMGGTGGAVSSMSVYVASPIDTGSHNQYQLAIYADSSGSPAALVASSPSGTLVGNSWNTVPVSANLSANTAYWLMYNSNGTSASVNNMRYSGGSSGQGAFSTKGQPFGTWPASFGGSTGGNEKFSIYATYTPSGSAPPPTVSITAPASGAVVTGASVSVSATASSSAGIAGVQFQLDGANLGLAVTTAPYAMIWDSTTAANGSHSLTAMATDGSGAQSTSSPITVTVSNSAAGTAQIGQWAAPFSFPIVAINLALMPTGKVLAFQGNESGSVSSGSAQVWDPATGAITPVSISLNDLFCAGAALLPDGRSIVIGGHSAATTGVKNANVFDPQTLLWSAIAPMNFLRWYPTATVLPDGRVLATGGATTCTTCYVQIPEVYSAQTNSWTLLNNAANDNTPSYPFMYVLPDGRVIQVGASEVPTLTQALDVNSQTWTTIDPRVIDGGSAVMFAPGKFMKAGSATDSGNSGPSAATTFVLDMTQPSPAWQQTASMAYPRSFLNLTALPDGTVLATGGESDKSGYSVANAIKPAELWSPATQTWTTMAAMQTPRLYHSTALLLPDGRVLVAGSGGDTGVPDELSAEIYSPPYLFKGARPTITSTPSAAIPYGSSFFVGTPDAAGISSVALIRTGAVTHAFDENARLMNLTFQQAPGGLSIQAPANANLAPPGTYLLFIVNSNGVPSVAPFVTLPVPGLDSQAPTPPTNLVAGGGAGSATLNWSPASDDVGVTAYNVYRGTSPGVVPSSANRVAQTSATSYTDTGLAAGAYYYVVTARDAAGNESDPSNEASATVTQGSQTATLGKTTVGGQFDDGDSNNLNGSRFTMPNNGGTATTMSVYIGTTSAAPNNQYQLAIYSDANGAPGTLVAQSATGQLTPNAWNTLTLSAPLAANAAYWLMFNTNGKTSLVNNMAYDAGGTSGWRTGGQPFGSWPPSFGAATVVDGMFSIYVTYTH
jgi:hypothetical protein